MCALESFAHHTVSRSLTQYLKLVSTSGPGAIGFWYQDTICVPFSLPYAMVIA
jgi:hypothetical protein